MHKMTLLDMTQNILSSMNSDEVNSIGDTVESLQVAEEVRNAFYDLYTNRDLPEFEGIVNLEALGDEDTPHLLKIPDNVLRLKWLKYLDQYNSRYVDIEYLDPEEFIYRHIIDRDNVNEVFVDVALTKDSPVRYTLAANRAPKYYTVFDDPQILVFDAFNAAYESFLTSSNSLAWGIKAVDFKLEDDFVPPIDAELFPHLLSEAKSACFINIKEVANSKEEQRARRQLVRSQTRLNNTNAQREGVFDATDFSRHSRGRTRYRYRHYRR